MVEPVRKTIEVACDPATAFAVFTERMGDWWPVEAHSISAMSGEAAKSVTIEPCVGGQVYEIKADGSRVDWARVTAFKPGERLELAWHVMTAEDRATKVEIRFTAAGKGTRVELTHKGWEILGEDAQAQRDGYGKGWVRVFEQCFAGACG